MSKPLSRWKKTKRRNVLNIVGRFFQELGAKILRARIPHNGSLDLAIEKILVGIEVKAGDYNNRLRIPVEQLDRHLKENLNLFPDMLENLIYCLFCYRNPKKPTANGSKHRRSRLSYCKDEIDIFSMLSDHTDSLYVFDHRVIQAIKKRFGTNKKKLPCDPEAEVILVGRNYLDSFTQERADEIFLSLKLDPADWAIRERYSNISIRIGLLAHSMKLRIVEVLPRDFMDRLDSVIKTPPIGVTSRRTLRLKETKKNS